MCLLHYRWPGTCTNKLNFALFACYCPDGKLNERQLKYLAELQTLPLKVRLLSTHPLVPPENLGDVEIISDRNEGLDFGLWFRELTGSRKQEYSECTNILLCNDSCFIKYGLKYTCDRMQKSEFWGMTSSAEIDLHVQSYFLFFTTPRAVQCLLEFVNTCKSTEGVSRKELIIRREIAISQFMATRNFPIDVAFPYYLISRTSEPENISYYHWIILCQLGCPLIKNKRHQVPQLLSARYSTAKRSVCIKERIIQLWDSGTRFEVLPRYLLCDPEINKPKTLTLTIMRENGETDTMTFREGEKVTPWSF